MKKYYYGNLSIFQSLPDVWAIGEMFPIMPIHRLDEQPTVRAVVSDITCDSDGRFRYYQTKEGDEILLHKLDKKTPPYLLGVFDVGAYQETIGDIHNLLSRPSVISVERDEKTATRWNFKVESEAETTADVIDFVDYPPEDIRKRIEDFFIAANNKNEISPTSAQKGIQLLDDLLKSSPYLNFDYKDPNIETNEN